MDAQLETALRQIGELVRACEQDFTSDDTETGEFAFADDDTVAAGETPTVLTFGDIRNARVSLELIRERLGQDRPAFHAPLGCDTGNAP